MAVAPLWVMRGRGTVEGGAVAQTSAIATRAVQGEKKT